MKIEMLSSKLEKDELAVIISCENRTYFTGFESSNGYLLVCANKSIFITDSRYIEAAKSEINNVDEIEVQQRIKSQIVNYANKLGIKKFLFETNRTTISDYLDYKKSFKDFEVSSEDKLDNIIKDLRLVKTEEEKEKIIKAQSITEKAFDHILTFIKEGITEKEIALELNYYMLKNGADDLSFETIAVSGKNSSKPHGVPSYNKVKNGDFITMDFGAVVDHYHSDMTRTVALGQVGSRQIQIYETVLKAQKKAISVVRSGIKASDCDFAARDIINKAGCEDCFGHGTGHGVGIEIHEAPTLSPHSSEILQVGNVITIEPGIYIKGFTGVRIEDMLYVTEDGSENLTNAPKRLIIL